MDPTVSIVCDVRGPHCFWRSLYAEPRTPVTQRSFSWSQSAMCGWWMHEGVYVHVCMIMIVYVIPCPFTLSALHAAWLLSFHKLCLAC